MGKPRGFLEIRRAKGERRPVVERLRDWAELEIAPPEERLREQAARCMDCGVPYCHDGCPLANLVPEWNDLIYSGRFEDAMVALHETNSFPEFTGRVCPAPCEASCVLNMTEEPVTIKDIERTIIDRAFEAGQVKPRPSVLRSGRRVVVVGSGPAGLAAAQELARRGHEVTVLEKADRPGGLLRYGIPDFKLDKRLIDRRLEQLVAEGVRLQTGVHAGVDVTGDELRRRYDAIVLAGGAERPRDLTLPPAPGERAAPLPGRELGGVHFAMDFLTQQNRRVAGELVPDDVAILAEGKRVVILGGGDTGSDCVGTSLRQGARHVLSLELLPRPPDRRRQDNPWPQWPQILRSSSSHDEGGERDFGVMTKRLVGDQGRVTALEAVRVAFSGGQLGEIPGSELTVPCDLVLLAMGFLGPVTHGLVAQLGVALDRRGNVATQHGMTSKPGIFAAGDMARGQSLVVWAIAEGRRVATAVDRWLSENAHAGTLLGRGIAVAGL